MWHCLRIVTEYGQVVPENISHGRGCHQGWARARGARGRRRLSRGCGDICRVSDPTTVTLRGRGRSSVMGRRATNPRLISSAITLMSGVRAAAAPAVHSFFPCLEYRAVSVMRGKLGDEKAKDICEGGRAPSEAVVRRVTYTTVAAKSAAIYSRRGIML